MGYAIHSKTRLEEKGESSFTALSNHRDSYEKIWKAYVGSHYGLSNPFEGKRTPLNLHALYARALVQYLAANRPQAMISTDVGPWKEWMEEVEFDVSRIMDEEELGRKQQLWVLSGLMYGPAVMKVCQDWKSVGLTDGGKTAAPTVMISNVDFSDFVFDTAASTIRDADFIGHKMRPAVDDLLANPLFEDVSEDWLRGMGGGAIHDNDRLFFENDDAVKQYRDRITLWEIFDRTTNEIVVWSPDAPGKRLLEYEWTGYRDGPLIVLDFQDVPNHAIGLSPMCILHDLHEAANRVTAKAIGQAEQAKNILVTHSANRADAEAIMESTDGEGVMVDDTNRTQMVTVGGPDPKVVGSIPVIKDLWNFLGGNVSELAGLGVQAPTATQEAQLAQMASSMVKFMGQRTQEAMLKVVQAITHYSLQDQVTTVSVPKKLPGGRSLWSKYGPDQRAAMSSALLRVNIDIYNKKYRTPEERKAELMTWWTQVAMPAYQIAQMQGMEYDLQALNRAYAKLTDLEEINDVAIYSMGPHAEQGGGSGSPMPMRQSPVTSRTNVRMDRGMGGNELGGDLASKAFAGEAA